MADIYPKFQKYLGLASNTMHRLSLPLQDPDAYKDPAQAHRVHAEAMVLLQQAEDMLKTCVVTERREIPRDGL